MTQEQIQYVREWARSGNEPRTLPVSARLVGLTLYMSGDGRCMRCTLNTYGLLIAKLADALEQANETAEECQSCCEGYLREKYEVDEQLTTMRANRLELLGR
jgi:hypothetical protein